ncbi:adhesion G-protein coupled receptor G1 isoform X2 [Tachysurus fulvidraco]|uniref:adhesion G-protein coupled receptor G1 isoform X2 n=1 Tax=Tachysurus fulvidraco TaxID=1234273 RepID=UPI001FEE1AAA|nr:adhesion G-protein coupled receptor G1 isoform X2 [Tachysurus fulvidraco]XP_047666416.1 adhesion G-protein coupled receptor G1 isoform X2 [Tachysurus fulvidraco]
MDQRVGFPLLLLILTVCGHATEGDRDFKMCGIWLHNSGPQTLDVDLKPGCSGISISANASTLSIRGSITAECDLSKERKPLSVKSPQGSSSSFCVIWEPLLDRLVVEVNKENITLCKARILQTHCCAHLSAGTQSASSMYGIQNGSVHGDVMSNSVMASYEFMGESINCKEYFCSKIAQESRGANMLEDVVMRSEQVGPVILPCGRSTVIEMNQDFSGNNVTLLTPDGTPQEMIPLVHLPACLKPAKRKTSKVVCSFYKNSTFFQKSSQKILQDVVGISVENEIIRNLPEPIRIKFNHPTLEKTQNRRCVSWDTRRDKDMLWRETGCVTLQHSAAETECCCHHLTYFAILVDLNPTRKLRHLEALTFITATCCAISIVSCAVLFVSLCRQRKLKNLSSLVHRGLVVALFFLLVLFVLTGTVANVASDSVCGFMGGLLHYALLSVLCWMAVEVIHTFWMMNMVFKPAPQPWIWYLLGFGFPAVPVVIMGCIGDIYGRRSVKSDDVLTAPFSMCWMTESQPALKAHFIINLGLLAAVVSSGLIVLFLVYRKIRHRDEWRRNRVAFLSIWGLSCLFGLTWVLAFFSAESSETVLFLFCIINSLQGFFLMLRFFALERIQKNSQSSSDFSSTGSTRQHMLQPQ